MEHTYHKLAAAGENNISAFLHWFQDAKVISKEDEPKVRQYFQETGDEPSNVSWAGLTKVLERVAKDRGEDYLYLVKFIGFDLLKKAIMSAVETKSDRRSKEK